MSKALTIEERLEIVTLSAAGQTDRAIATRPGWSVSVVRKWRRRHQSEGRAGLVSKMGRPSKGALSSYLEQVRTQVTQMRQQHPGWGAKTIHAELCKNSTAKCQPAPASIGRYLKEKKRQYSWWSV